MSNRHAGYIVTLRADVEEGMGEKIVTALLMVRGVLSVKPIVSDAAVHVAEERVRIATATRLSQLARDVMSGVPRKEGE